MISEGSCDTEDWSNDAENSVLYHRNKLHIYSNRLKQLFKINNISQYYYFYCIFSKYMQAGLVKGTSFKNIKISFRSHIFEHY